MNESVTFWDFVDTHRAGQDLSEIISGHVVSVSPCIIDNAASQCL